MIIEIFSDLICPWCYIGKRRLDSVLSTPVGEGIEVVWRAFQLYPGIPRQGMSRRDFLDARYGADSGGSGARDHIVAEAAGVGIDLNFDDILRMPNTFDGHRLLNQARVEGRQHALAEALFRCYFEQGRDVGDPAVLRQASVDAGMDPEIADRVLAGEQGADAVRAELDRAANIGVNGVPCYLFSGAFALPGAQSPDVIAAFIERARSRLVAG